MNRLVSRICFGYEFQDGQLISDGQVIGSMAQDIRHDLRIGTAECVNMLEAQGYKINVKYDQDNYEH